MYLHDKFSFAAQGLAVSYQESASPQLLDVVLETPHATRNIGCVLPVRAISNLVDVGLAGGSTFPPGAAKLKLISGPSKPSDPGTEGPEFHWQFEIDHVCREFIRLAIEWLAFGTAEFGNFAKRLSMTGQNPLLADNRSLDTQLALACLASETAFPGRWPTPPFNVRAIASGRGALLQITFESATARIASKLDKYLARVDQALAVMPNRTLTAPAINGPFVLARTKSQIAVRYESFEGFAPPAHAAFVNMLCHFHQREAKILQVELNVPER